jgi:hypothetical protein
LIYHSLSILAGSSSSSAFEKVMYCFRSSGKDPGRLASSMRSCCSVSSICVGAPPKIRAVEIEGWDMEFWPVMTSPFARLTLMWCVKLVLMAGRTDVWLGTEQMLERR